MFINNYTYTLQQFNLVNELTKIIHQFIRKFG